MRTTVSALMTSRKLDEQDKELLKTMNEKVAETVKKFDKVDVKVTELERKFQTHPIFR